MKQVRKRDKRKTIPKAAIKRVLDAVRSGENVTTAVGKEKRLSIGSFYRLMTEDEKLKAEYNLAQKASTYVMADMVRDMGMNALQGKLPEGCQNHNVPKLGLEAAKWHTSRRNPEEFGDKPSVAVQVNLVDDLLGDSRTGGANPLADMITVESKG